MTPQQHNAEAVRAHQNRMEAMGNIYDRTQGAMADIHAKVVSEPWYGRDVFDHTFDRRMGYGQGQGVQDTGTIHGPAQEPAKEQGTVHGQGPGTAHAPQAAQEDVMKSFYGNGQQPGHDQGQGRGRGIEP
jgi:hypothetical protein